MLCLGKRRGNARIAVTTAAATLVWFASLLMFPGELCSEQLGKDPVQEEQAASLWQKTHEAMFDTDDPYYLHSPITISLADALTEISFLDGFNPKPVMPMTLLPLSTDGGFRLVLDGVFEHTLQSFCLARKRGGPRADQGLLYAPLKGPAADIFKKILRGAVRRPDIQQKDVQSLLYAIIESDREINLKHKRVRPIAERLLTASDLERLGRIESERQHRLERLSERWDDWAATQKPLDSPWTPVEERELKQARSHEDRDNLEKVFAKRRLDAFFAVGEVSAVELDWLASRKYPNLESRLPSRTIPKGRWSYHVDGFFIRYFATWTHRIARVQIAIPRRIVVAQDEQGRIVSVAHPSGDAIVTTYEDEAAVTVDGDPGVKGQAFRSIRFLRKSDEAPKEVTWDNLGWTLAGVPSGDATFEKDPESFPRLSDRYQSALTHVEEVRRLDEGLAALRRQTGHLPMDGAAQESRSRLRDLVDLASYFQALEAAITDQKNTPKWAGTHLNLLKKAWMWIYYGNDSVGIANREMPGDLSDNLNHPLEQALSQLATSLNEWRFIAMAAAQDSGGSKEFHPSDDVATPGDRGRQSLAFADADDPCAKQRQNSIAAEDELDEAWVNLVEASEEHIKRHAARISILLHCLRVGDAHMSGRCAALRYSEVNWRIAESEVAGAYATKDEDCDPCAKERQNFIAAENKLDKTWTMIDKYFNTLQILRNLAPVESEYADRIPYCALFDRNPKELNTEYCKQMWQSAVNEGWAEGLLQGFKNHFGDLLSKAEAAKDEAWEESKRAGEEYKRCVAKNKRR